MQWRRIACIAFVRYARILFDIFCIATHSEWQGLDSHCIQAAEKDKQEAG